MKKETIIVTKYDLKKLSIYEISQWNIDKIIAKHAKKAPEGASWAAKEFKNGNIHISLIW